MATSGLGNLLVNEGLLTENDRRTITDTAGPGSSSFAKGVLALGLLDEEELATFIATRTRFPLAARIIDNEMKGDTSRILPHNLLKFLEVLPLRADDTTLTLAMVDPLDRETAHQAEFFSGRRVKPVVATLTQIAEGLRKILPDFMPSVSPLEEFLANHAESAGRHLGMVGGQAPDTASDAASEEHDDASQAEEPESSPALETADLNEVDTISKDVAEAGDIGANEDPFAKMDGLEDEPAVETSSDAAPLEAQQDTTTENPVDDMDASVPAGAEAAAPPMSEAEAAFAAAAADGGDELSTELETPTAETPSDMSAAPQADAPTLEPEVDRPMAEAAQQEEAALAQELGLETVDMAQPDSPSEAATDVASAPEVAIEPAMETSEANPETASNVDDLSADLNAADPAADLSTSDLGGDLGMSEPAADTPAAGTAGADEASLLSETATEAPLTPDPQTDSSPLEDDFSLEAVAEETAPAAEEPMAVADDIAALTADDATPSVAEEAPVQVAEEISAPAAPIAAAPVTETDGPTSAQRIATLNRTLLAIQMAATADKALEETAKGLGKAACLPGILLGRGKDGGKNIFVWDGDIKAVKVTHAQLGQLDTKSLEDAAANAPEGIVTPLSTAGVYGGITLAANKGYVVSFPSADGLPFIAAFEAGADFRNETGLHQILVELLRRVSLRMK